MNALSAHPRTLYPLCFGLGRDLSFIVGLQVVIGYLPRFTFEGMCIYEVDSGMLYRELINYKSVVV